MREREILRVLRRPADTLDRIREVEAQIRALEAAMLPAGVAFDRDRVQGTKDDRLLRFIGRVEDKWARLDWLRDRYLEEIAEVERLIDQVADGAQRAVLTRLFVEQMSVKELAAAEHYAESSIYRLRRLGLARIAAFLRAEDDSKWERMIENDSE